MVKAKQIFAALALPALTACYLQASGHYPFYFQWDMDHLTLVDLLAMNEGKLPAHLQHPGFGMYLLGKLALWLASAAGSISLTHTEELRQLASPLQAIADTTNFLRRLSPLAVAGTVVLLWSACAELFSNKTAEKRNRGTAALLSAAILAAFAFESSTYVNATMIRSETYALLFWAAALLCQVRMAEKVQNERSKLSFLSGLFLGLSFLTKVQGLALILAMPVLGILFERIFREKEKGNENETLIVQENPFTKHLPAINLAATILLLSGAALSSDAPLLAGDQAGSNLLSRIFLLTAVALAVTGIPRLRNFLADKIGIKRENETEPFASQKLQLLYSGFLASFLLHFAAYANPLTSLSYLLADTRMIFFRNTIIANHVVPYEAANLFEAPAKMPVTIALFLLLTAVSGWLFRKEPKVCGAVALLFLLNVVNTLFCTRPMLRDLLWLENFFLVSNLCLLALALTKIKANSGALAFPLKAALALGIGLFAGQTYLAQKNIKLEVEAVSASFGWRLQTHLKGTEVFLKGNRSSEEHDAFSSSLAATLDTKEKREFAISEILLKQPWLDTAKFVLPNLELTENEAREAVTGAEIASGLKLKTIPAELSDAHLINATPLEPKKISFNPAFLSKTQDRWNPYQFGIESKHILVLPRADLEIYYFRTKEVCEKLGVTGPRLEAESGQATISFTGQKLNGFQELPQPLKTEGPSFFLLRRAPLAD